MCCPVKLPPRHLPIRQPGRHWAVLSGISMVLEQLDHISQSVSELGGAAHLSQHAEEVSVRDPLPADVGEQVGVIRWLAQDDLGVVCVEVNLEGIGKENMSGPQSHASVTKMANVANFFVTLFTTLHHLFNKHISNYRVHAFFQTCRVPLLKSMTRACSVFTHWSSRGGGPETCSSQSRSPPWGEEERKHFV